MTGIIHRVVELQHCRNCQSFGHSAKTCGSKTKCLICGESHHHERYPNKVKCANCKGPHVKTFTFSAEQLVKFVANVAIQVPQPQVCCGYPTQETIDKKSSLLSQSFRSCQKSLMC